MLVTEKMGELDFYLVDVFAEKRYSGNQLAVVNAEQTLSSKQMQEIANEMHFSETTFIFSKTENNYNFRVRIFTPSTEVPFAGHPTLGTAFIIKHLILHTESNRILLNLNLGQIPVTFENTGKNEEILWMEQISPVFGKIFGVAYLAELLGLEMKAFDLEYPIQQVSTGLPFIIVPLKTLGDVKRARVNQEKLNQLAKQGKAGILVFCPETYKKENNLNVRVFVDLFGISEDPATGSGNGCLAAYLLHNRYFNDTHVDIRVEQGYELNRPSLLFLKAGYNKKNAWVKVGGQVFLVGSGKLKK